ncbi:MAG: 50S ribosomal protein L17 [Bdellovibrionales bacterium]
MRHKSKRHNFHRRPGPRVALIRGMVYSLVEHGRIKTTVARAKEVRRHVEKAITLGKKGTLHARRLLLSRFPNDGVVDLITTDLQKRFGQRPGGYTRIVKVGARPGDQADMAFLEFVDYVPPQPRSEETVKGDTEEAPRKRVKAAQRARVRKNVRRIQAKSRREARV